MRHHKEAPITNRALVTFAYNPVSISLYARHGMYPRDPIYYMECPSGQVKTGPTNTKLKNESVTDFEKNKTILSRIDQRTLGFPREKNHEFLFSLSTLRCHLYHRKRTSRIRLRLAERENRPTSHNIADNLPERSEICFQAGSRRRSRKRGYASDRLESQVDRGRLRTKDEDS